MVHNGIEYGDMQLISEVYDILKVRVTSSTLKMGLWGIVAWGNCSVTVELTSVVCWACHCLVCHHI